MAAKEQYFTIPQIAKELGVTESVVRYALRTHGPEAAIRLGYSYGFSQSQLKQIAKSVEMTDSRTRIRERVAAQ